VRAAHRQPGDSAGRADRQPLERRHGHVAVEVVAVRSVDVRAHPDARVGELDRPAEEARQRRRRRGGIRRHGALVHAEAELMPLEPGPDQGVVVVAGDDHHAASAERPSQRLQHRPRRRERPADGPAAKLHHIAQQHEAVDALQSRDQRRERRRLAKHVGAGVRAEVEV
jgi:hypothetical protein